MFRKLGPIQQLASLEAAWDIASDQELRALVPLVLPLLLRGSTSSLRTRARDLVARRWTAVPQQIRQDVLHRTKGWEEPVRALLGSPDAAARLSATVLAADIASPGMIRSLGVLAADPSAEVAEEAARALRDLARSLARVGPRSLEALVQALAVGLGRRTGVTRAARGLAVCALELLDAPWRVGVAGESARALRAILTDPDRGVLRSVLRGAPEPTTVRAAVGWLADPAASAVAADLLHRAPGPGLSAGLGRAHLLARWARAHSLRDRPARAPAELPPIACAVREWSPREQRGLPHWMVALAPLGPSRSGWWDAVLASADPVARLHGVTLAQGREVEDLLFDAHPVVARSAFRRWSLAGGPWRSPQSPAVRARLRVASRLKRHPDPIVRREAAVEAACLQGQRGSGRSRPLERLGLMLVRTRAGGEDVRRVLDAALRSDDQAVRADAAQHIRAAGLGDRMAPALIRMVERAEVGDRAAASAARALRGVGVARGALRAALGHSDSRLAADALEALLGPGPPDPSARDVLEAGLGDARRRVRANASRAAIVEPALHARGASAVRELLLSTDATDRSAGLWAVGRAGAVAGRDEDLRGLVAALAVDERHPETHARARLAAHRLRLNVETWA